MVGKFYQIPILFPTIFRSGNGSQKSQFFNWALKKRGALSHFFIRDWEASQSNNHFCGKMELFTNVFGLRGLAIHSLAIRRSTRFSDMWLLFSAAMDVV